MTALRVETRGQEKWGPGGGRQTQGYSIPTEELEPFSRANPGPRPRKARHWRLGWPEPAGLEHRDDFKGVAALGTFQGVDRPATMDAKAAGVPGAQLLGKVPTEPSLGHNRLQDLMLKETREDVRIDFAHRARTPVGSPNLRDSTGSPRAVKDTRHARYPTAWLKRPLVSASNQ